MSNEKTSPFKRIGGEPGVRRLVDRFYDLMDKEAEAVGIRALHPTSLDGSREKLRLFLIGWLGGPPVYVEYFGPPMLRARHLPFRIGERERDAWIWCMSRALDHPDVPADLASFLRERLGAIADHMRNAPGEGG